MVAVLTAIDPSIFQRMRCRLTRRRRQQTAKVQVLAQGLIIRSRSLLLTLDARLPDALRLERSGGAVWILKYWE